MSDEEIGGRNPLRKLAVTVGGTIAGLGGIVGSLLQLGVLTPDQAIAINAAGQAVEPTINGLGVLAGGVIPIIAGLAAAFGIARTGEKVVTPNIDPRDNAGNPLTPDPSAGYGEHAADPYANR
jgi:hypothetical protein